METHKTKIIVVFSSHLGDFANRNFINHIHNTIGTIKHDVIHYENYNQYSLSELYNKTVNEYKEDNTIFVFCHPDIIIKTQNWGMKVIKHFNTTSYGVLGVAGTTFLSETGKWWESQNTMCGVVQHTDGKKVWENKYSEEFNGVEPVVTIDGLFFAVDFNRVENLFNEGYGKFHFYDIPFCVDNYLTTDIGVITSIRILHKSIGETNTEWEENRVKFCEEYKHILPLKIEPKYEDLSIELKSEPKVSIIIPTKNNFSLLHDNIISWSKINTYKNYEIIIADTGSDEDVIEKYSILSLLNDKVQIVRYDYYNFGKINNDVVKNHVSSDTELILFCNDDIELLNDALTRCVEIYLENKKSVGTIGIRLHFFDSSVQHCGVLVMKDKEEQKRISHIDFRKGVNYSTNVKKEVIGNTGAFLLIEKDLFIKMDMFNENYIECFEDVELGIKCINYGKKNMTVCDAVAYHHESVSRNKTKTKKENTNTDYFERLLPLLNENEKKLKKYIKKL